MGAKGEQTREHIMATAESIILNRGYSGTSIEDIIRNSSITKGGFFYHFDGKSDLARSLINRYLKNDTAFFADIADRARSLTEDPLQQLLLYLKLLAEAMEDLPGTHPGCLVASFTYESEQFDDEIRGLMVQGALSWRVMFMELFERVAEKYTMKIEMPLEELGDMLTSVIEGGILMSRVLDDRTALPKQILQYRNYIRLLYGDT
jgi:TetR/AcrR family transcriptional regulator, transcriptional repressor for nem operon